MRVYSSWERAWPRSARFVEDLADPPVGDADQTIDVAHRVLRVVMQQ
jgi:hypothetical protein